MWSALWIETLLAKVMFINIHGTVDWSNALTAGGVKLSFHWDVFGIEETV
jgi:hypothetical protein